jgi:DNA-binding NarL/FixJ family response regulator
MMAPMTDKPRIRILLVVGQALFLRGLVSLLHAEPDFEVVGVVGDGLEAVKRSEACRPDVICLDVHLPGGTGFEAARRLRMTLPAVKVVMLADALADAELREAVASGVQGYLLKEAEPQSLCEALRGVARGETAFPGRVMASLLALIRGDVERPASGGSTRPEINAREREVLALVAQGKSNKEIAVALDLAENTIKNDLKRILARLQLENRVQAAAFAFRQGLVPSTATLGLSSRGSMGD